MNKILKHKKIIAFILIFTLSFGVISDYKQKETHAVVIADDVLIMLMLGALVTGSGVIALSQPQIRDMGSRVLDNLPKFGLEKSDIIKLSIDGTIEGIKIVNGLKSAINDVIESLPINDIPVSNPDTVVYPTNSIPLSTSSFPTSPGHSDKETMFKMENLFYSVTINMPKDDYINLGASRYYVGAGINEILVTSFFDPNSNSGRGYYFYRAWVTYPNSFGYYDGLTVFSSSDTFSTNLSFPEGVEILDKNYITTIPYSNTGIKENYNPTYTNENLKENTYLPLPTDTGVFDDVSTDFPLTWDNVKDMVLPIPTDDTDTSIPGTDTGEGDIDTELPDTGTDGVPSIWSWLQGLLSTIIGLLTNIWEVISSLVSSLIDALTGLFTGLLEGIGELLSSLVNAISKALEFLFVPSISLENAFEIPNGGFAQLVQFFNWDNLWNLEPKPYEFIKDITIFPNAIPSDSDGKVVDSSRVWHVELKPFSISYVEDYLPIFRNVMSYSILITVLWAIIHHLLPKRGMD